MLIGEVLAFVIGSWSSKVPAPTGSVPARPMAAGAVGRYSVLHHRVKNDAKDER
jgi:hypothetical protein